MPEVSVIIPTYNSARYLTEAVDSVLSQTFRDFEILVVDDGSTDETKEVMRKYGPPVRYIRQENGGVARARNRAIEESHGRYVAFLDADDTWFPSKLDLQIRTLASHPANRLCYSAFSVVDSELTAIRVNRSKRRGTALEDLLLRGNIIGSICTVLCERELFAMVGGFDPDLSQCADWDMWVRIAALTEFAYLDDPLATYRHHGTMMSNNAKLLENDSVRVLEKGFAMPDLSTDIRERRRAALARNYTVLAGTYLHSRRYADCVRCAVRATVMDVRQVGYMAAFPVRMALRLRPNHSQ